MECFLNCHSLYSYPCISLYLVFSLLYHVPLLGPMLLPLLSFGHVLHSHSVHWPWGQQLSARRWAVWLGFCSNTGKLANWLLSCLLLLWKLQVEWYSLLVHVICLTSNPYLFLIMLRLPRSFLPSLPIQPQSYWPFSCYLSHCGHWSSCQCRSSIFSHTQDYLSWTTNRWPLFSEHRSKSELLCA